MQQKETLADFRIRATEIRRIAESVFDSADRKTLLQFVDDSEKMAGRALAANDE
jgi:hypothetical protein